MTIARSTVDRGRIDAFDDHHQLVVRHFERSAMRKMRGHLKSATLEAFAEFQKPVRSHTENFRRSRRWLKNTTTSPLGGSRARLEVTRPQWPSKLLRMSVSWQLRQNLNCKCIGSMSLAGRMVALRGQMNLDRSGHANDHAVGRFDDPLR